MGALLPGRYRPACRMTQIGALSVGSPRAARNMRSFLKGGKSLGSLESCIFNKNGLTSLSRNTCSCLYPACVQCRVHQTGRDWTWKNYSQCFLGNFAVAILPIWSGGRNVGVTFSSDSSFSETACGYTFAQMFRQWGFRRWACYGAHIRFSVGGEIKLSLTWVRHVTSSVWFCCNLASSGSM